MKIVVHHLQYSRSTRMLWLLEELGLDYELVTYERDANFRAPPEMAKIHPLGRAPIVVVDGEPLVESGAVTEALVDIADGKLRPTDPAGLRRFRFWMHYAEGSVMPPLLARLLMDKVKEAKLPFFIKPIAKKIADKVDDNYAGPEIDRHFSYIESQLAKSDYFCGAEFTAADVQMYYPIEGGLARRAGHRPKAEAWLARVKERPALKAALEKGGPVVPS